MIKYIFHLINAIISIILIYRFLNLKLDYKCLLLTAGTFIEFCVLDTLVLIPIYLISTVLYLYIVNKVEFSDAFLFSLLTAMIYLSSGLIKSSFFPSWRIQNFNDFERTVIFSFMVLFTNNVLCSKNNQYIRKKVIFSLSLGTLSAMFVIMFFAKISLGKSLNDIEKFVGSFSAIFICYILVKYYRLFDDSFNEIDITKQMGNKYKYRIINQPKLTATYEKSSKMNHNIKYILLNIKLLLKNKSYEEAIGYIDKNLNKIEENQSIFTDNPYFDYLLNKFGDSLSKLGLSCNKNINISKNSIFSNWEYCNEITEYFDYQLNLIKQISPKSISLIIYEKGDFLIIKTIFFEFDQISIKINCSYKFENGLLITSLILDVLDD